MPLLKRYGHEVFFATPLCVGFSEKLARDTIESLWAAGLVVYVHSTGSTYAKGADMTEFYEKLGHEANAAHVRAHRKRKS